MNPWLERTGPRSKQRLFLCATDSYSAVRAPVELRDELTGKPIVVPDSLLGPLPIKAMSHWAKGEKLVVTADKVQLRLTGEMREFDRPKDVVPNIAKIMRESIGNLSDEFTIAFNPDLLTAAAKAMGLGGKNFTPLVIRFQDAANGALRPFILTTTQSKGKTAGDLDVAGLLMPIRVGSSA